MCLHEGSIQETIKMAPRSRSPCIPTLKLKMEEVALCAVAARCSRKSLAQDT